MFYVIFVFEILYYLNLISEKYRINNFQSLCIFASTQNHQPSTAIRFHWTSYMELHFILFTVRKSLSSKLVTESPT